MRGGGGAIPRGCVAATRDISRLGEGAPSTQWVEARVLLHSLQCTGQRPHKVTPPTLSAEPEKPAPPSARCRPAALPPGGLLWLFQVTQNLRLAPGLSPRSSHHSVHTHTHAHALTHIPTAMALSGPWRSLTHSPHQRHSPVRRFSNCAT